MMQLYDWLKGRSFRQKLLAVAILVEVVTVALLSLSSMRQIESILYAQLSSRVEEAQPSLIAALGPPLAQGNLAAVTATLSELQRRHGLAYVAVMDSDGRVLRQVGPGDARPLPVIASGERLIEAKRLDRRVDLVVGEKNYGYMQYGASIDVLETTRNQLLTEAISVLIATAALATLLIVALGYRVTRRLSRLTDASRKLAAGDLDVRMEAGTSDEIGQLAQALNTMARTLQSRIDELHNSEERLALVVRGSADGIWDWDLRTNEVHFSARFRELLGYEDEPEFQRDFLFSACLNPEDRERTLAAQSRYLTREVAIFDEEYRLRCRDGSYRWFRGRGQALWDGDGKAYRYASSISDIDTQKRTRDALRRSEQRLYHAVRGASDGIWDWDIAHGEYYISPRLKELLGYTDDELPNDRSSFLDALHPDDRPRIEAEVNRHFERHTPYDTEYRLRRKDGTYRWFRGRGQAVWDSDGRVVRFAGASSDISIQRQAQENIRALLAEKQALLDNAVVGIVHVRNRVILSCNRRYEEMFGYGDGEMIGKTTEVIFPTRKICEEFGQEAYATIARGEHYSAECQLKRKDGTLFWGLITGRAVAPKKPQEGSIWIHTDVDKQHKAIDALVRERNLSDALIGSMPAIFYLCDRNYRLVRWNEELTRRFGLSDQQLEQTRVLDFFRPHQVDQTRRVIDAAFDFGPQVAEVRLQLPGGSSPYYLLTGRRIDIDGSAYMVGVGFDITDRKLAEREVKRLNEQLERRVAERTAELQAANRELESFSYSVSHDLSAPLRGMDGFSRMLEEDFSDKVDERGKNYIHRIRAGAHRMQRLIDDLLSLSRVSRDEMRRQRFDLSSMAADILGELRNSQPSRDVETVIAPHLSLSADPNLMRIAMENLLRNAWKFTAKHRSARIELGVLQMDGKSVYFVRDDGAGFDMRYAAKLFGAFQRMHRVSDFEGTGIGLAIVSRIIHRHGGRIWAEAAVEQGSTFYFTLS